MISQRAGKVLMQRSKIRHEYNASAVGSLRVVIYHGEEMQIDVLVLDAGIRVRPRLLIGDLKTKRAVEFQRLIDRPARQDGDSDFVCHQHNTSTVKPPGALT